MMINLALAMWSYSLYLTLADGTLIVYIMMLIVAAGWCIFREAGDKTESFQTIGVIFNAGLYSFLVFYVGKSYFSYRSTGGLNPGPGQKTEFQKKLEVGSYQDQVNMLVDHNMKRGVKDKMV